MHTWIEEAARRLAVTVPGVSAADVPEGTWIVVHVARSPLGQVVTYAPTLERHSRGMWDEVVVVRQNAADLQARAVGALEGLVGAGAVIFGTHPDASPMLVQGPADSAAWTLDACPTSLYENHVRAILDLPLGTSALHQPSAAACAVCWAPGLVSALRHCMARDPAVRVHLAGTEGVRGMTIGHTCVIGVDDADVVRRARHAADYLTGTIEE